MKSLLFKTLAVALVSSSLLFSSCLEEAPTVVSVHFEPVVGTESYNINQTYNIDDIAFSFTQFYFYVHDVSFTRSSSEADNYFDKYLLVDGNQGVYELGAAEEGSINGIEFNIGVDSITNSQTEEAFTTRTADDPLAQQDPVMHWNWATGYRFVRIEGMVDSDGDGTPEMPFARHIGHDEMLRFVSLTASKDIIGDSQEMVIQVDLAKIFENSDIITDPIKHGMDADMMDNMVDAFTVL